LSDYGFETLLNGVVFTKDIQIEFQHLWFSCIERYKRKICL